MAEENENLQEPETESALSFEAGIPAAPETDSRKRLFIIGGAVLAVVLIAGLVFFFMGESSSSSPSSNNPLIVNSESVKESSKKKRKIKYEKLYNQLESGSASKILKELSLAGIQFKTEQSGQKYSILIDETQIDNAQNLLAIKGLPSNAAVGYELLDDTQTLGVTEFDKRIRFLRALSGELEKAITQINIIEAAKVQVVLPEQRLFTVTQPPVTASIIIRIQEGKKIDDEIVFSIIQLVSNSVENLQPENISVVSTKGELLSDNIFERMAQRRNGTFVEEDAETDAAISREEAIGYPIIPNYQQIQNWFDIKWQFEETLKEKVFRQLLGIMPLGSFKVEITTDIGAVENGSVVDIQRQTISVVVDGLNDEIFVDQAFKQQVFSTVAGTIGYIRGRDSIQLSVAEFQLYSEEELNALRRKYITNNSMLYAGIALALVAAGLLFIWYRRRNKKEEEPEEAPKVELKENIDDFETIEANTAEEKINEIKGIANFEANVIAKVMSDWIQSENPEPATQAAPEPANELGD